MDVGFAVLGALGYGLASVLQAVGARGRGGPLRTMAHPAYLAGLALDLLAWLASLVALRTLAVYEVQALLAGSVAVTAVGARYALGHRLRRADLGAIVVTTGALAVLAASAGPQHDVSLSTPGHWALAATVVPVAVAGWIAARVARPAVSGALAGLAFGGAALCARAVPVPSTGRGRSEVVAVVAGLAGDPLTWALAGFGGLGMVLYAHALEHGEVGPVTALLWISEVVVPSVVGVLLLHDSVRAGRLGVAVVALGVVTVAAAVLAGADPVPEQGGTVPGQGGTVLDQG